MNSFIIRLTVFLSLSICIIVSMVACDTPNGPEKSARSAFETFARKQRVPYKDVDVQILKKDDAYATLRITVWFRESAQSDWEEKYADVESRNVGEQWQSDSSMTFVDTPAEQQRKQATSVARTAATATAEAVQLETEKQQKLALLYNKGLEAFEQSLWWDASYYMKQVVELDPGYKNAKQKLEEARQKTGTIAFLDGSSTYMMNADGGNVREIGKLSEIGYASSVTLSPDGRLIAMIGKDDDQPAIKVVDLEGNLKSSIKIARENVRYAKFYGFSSLAWSPDRMTIAATSRDIGGENGIIIIDVVTKESHLFCPSYFGGNLGAFSPDGNKIVFQDSSETINRIRVLDRQSGQCSVLIGWNKFIEQFAWSPDGQTIAFLSQRDSLVVMNADGSDPSTLIEHGSSLTNLDWSLDGKMIAYTQGNNGIFVINSNGTGGAVQIFDFKPYGPNNPQFLRWIHSTK